MDTTSLSDDFLHWARDSARTLEERFGILRFMEAAYVQHYRGPDKVGGDWKASMILREKRRFDAAFRPVLDEKRLRLVADLLPDIMSLDLGSSSDDRPLRDLGVLRFLPQLTELKLADLEMEDLGIVLHLPVLREFTLRFYTVQTNAVEDYSALACCPELRKITLFAKLPWPVLIGWENLLHLEELVWQAPGSALQSIPRLPALRKLMVDGSSHVRDLSHSIRDFHQLPEMPELESFWGGDFYRLDGIERYPKLRFLCVGGFFRTLQPLSTLTRLTHLRVVSPELRDIMPIVPLPILHQFAVVTKRPQDYTPLMEAPALRELYSFGCDTPQMDLDAVRFVLPPDDDVFAVATPRPLAPLRLRLLPKNNKPDPSIAMHEWPDGSEGWDGYMPMRESEARWVNDLIHDTLEQANYFKIKGIIFKKTDLSGSRVIPGSGIITGEPVDVSRVCNINLLKVEALSRLREVLDCIRTALARTRVRWTVLITGYAEPDADEWDESWRNEDRLSPQAIMQDMLESHLEEERKANMEQGFLNDEFRLKLLREQGEEPKPEDFIRSPIPDKPVPPGKSTGGIAVAEPPPDDEDPPLTFEPPKTGWSPDDDDDDEGGLAEAEPGEEDNDEHWLPPPPNLNPNISWTGLTLYCYLTEDSLWIYSHHDYKTYEYLLGIPAENPLENEA